jgi:hypothetical protein
MAVTPWRNGTRNRAHGVGLIVLVLAVALSACAGAPPAVSDTGHPVRGARQPTVSYLPNCSGAGEPRCLSGTEVQALETFRGRLYTGTTNWQETLATIWPRTSAQINVLASEGGTWRRTPELPGSSKCAPGNAPWEQVNDLHAATFARQGRTAQRLLAGVLANEDGACPGLQASVFALDARGRTWVNTGLDARLEHTYGTVNSEVRYIETFSDGTADCPADRPCVFAFVGPRGGTTGPSVWRGIYNFGDSGCVVICWDSDPEVVMDGVDAPPAARIVSSASGSAGLFFGTTALGRGRCLAEGKGEQCNRAALMERVAPRTWETAWLGAPVRDGGPDQVRGIASWKYRDGAQSLWFITGPVGTVSRIDSTAGARSAPVAERTLGEFLPESCNARMLPYQLYVHERELLVASEACGYTPRDSFARIFHRPIARDGEWEVLNLPTVTSVGADRSNEAAVRWIETSPFDRRDVYFGTTDMNNTPGSLTARVYRLRLRLP